MIIKALRNSTGHAVVSACRRLVYTDGAVGDTARPAFVRAASGLAAIGERLVVVQDDTNYLAVLARDGACTSLALPPGRDGLRTFSAAAGTKPYKWDLESVFYDPARDLMLAFGSGSAPERDRIVLAEGWRGGAPRIRVVQAPSWYDALRRRTDFSGSELNLEGAVLMGEAVLLFNRGNGAPAGALQPVNAVGAISYAALLAYLAADVNGAPPALDHVQRYDLGVLAGVRLTFTDAAVDAKGHVYFLAVAEDSPNAYADGPAVGTVFGRLHPDGSAMWCPVVTAAGAPFIEKAEGLAFTDSGAYLAIDTDDPTRPSELWELRIQGW